MDRSSGYSAYKQQSNAPDSYSQESVSSSWVVPLQLIDIETNEVLWENLSPSSPLNCRPVKLEWINETIDVLLEENQNFKQEIEALTPFDYGTTKVSYFMHFTMVVGKVSHKLEAKVSQVKSFLTVANTDFS